MRQVHMRVNGHNLEDLQQVIGVLRIEEKRNLSDVKKLKVSEGIQVSQVEGLSLAECVIAKKCNCNLNHKDCKRGCQEMVNAGQIVLKDTDIKYDCEKVQRRLHA